MKYVHQACLEDWIKNCNKTIQETTKNNQIFYMITCEICKYQMKYTKSYKNNFFVSITKLIRSIFSSLKSTFLFGVHSVVLYFICKRFTLLLNELPRLLSKRRKPSFFMNLFHNITIFISIGMALDDIYNFYKQMYIRKRKCVVQFLQKSN